MNLTTESLQAFTQAAACGSFSAAARRLGKSQSTLSEAVARLEIDLGVELFIRGPRRLQLTAAGHSLLAHAEAMLQAGDRLTRQAACLAHGQEARLTLALSDLYPPRQYAARLLELDQRYPQLEFESLIAEQADVLELVSQGRAQLGLLAAQSQYPPDIASARLASHSEFGLFVATSHPLARLAQVGMAELEQWRALRLSSVAPSSDPLPLPVLRSQHQWSAPDYLLLLEMAVLGFGWAELPRPLVQAYAHGRLHELAMAGWPRRVAVDVVWSRRHAPGPVAAWLLDRLLAQD